MIATVVILLILSTQTWSEDDGSMTWFMVIGVALMAFVSVMSISAN